MSDWFQPVDFTGPVFWDFWQISGRYAKWSKYHLFCEEGKHSVTACGRWPQPDNYQPIVNSGQMPRIDQRCKVCQKIYEKEYKVNIRERIKRNLPSWRKRAYVFDHNGSRIQPGSDLLAILKPGVWFQISVKDRSAFIEAPGMERVDLPSASLAIQKNRVLRVLEKNELVENG